MSNNNQNQWLDDEDDFDFEDEEVMQKPKGNDLLKQLRKQLRQAEARDKEREAELQTLRSSVRQSTVAQILENEGVPSKIAKFIPADITEEGAVKAWLDENADVFGFNRAPQGEISSDEAALMRMNNVADGALSPSLVEDLWARIDRAESPEEVDALLAQIG